nr:unnamed protein product [Ananas comosus var. bracteatus]
MIARWMDLTDTIVKWKGSLRRLEQKNLDIYAYLDSSNNQLSGKIPAALDDLQYLKLFNLSYNKLEGEIPASFGRLIKQESLDLSHNRLNGSIPEAFVNLNELATLDVSNNELTGQIPIGRQMSTMANSSSYANNSGLCGFEIGVPCGFSPATGQVSEPSKEEKDMRQLIWGGMQSGYPFGLLLAVILSYIGGFFHRAPARHRQHNQRNLRRGA